MKRALIRAVWGEFTGESMDDCKTLKEYEAKYTSPKPSKLVNDITYIAQHTDKCSFVTYVFGKYNTSLISVWFPTSKVIKIAEEPSMWDMKTELYRHKLEVFKAAMEDFDEIVYLDWDCVPQKKVGNEIWGILNKKESFQANLQLYKTKKCLWRKEDQRKTCNGGFVYMRDKKIPDLLIKNWESFKTLTENQRHKREEKGLDLRQREKSLIYDDEPSMSLYVDDVMCNWKGMNVYWNHFEPDICNLNTKSAYSEEKIGTKDIYFKHML